MSLSLDAPKGAVKPPPRPLPRPFVQPAAAPHNMWCKQAVAATLPRGFVVPARPDKALTNFWEERHKFPLY